MRVERHRTDGSPVAGTASPAAWSLLAGGLVELVSTGKQGRVETLVAVDRGYEAEARVQVLGVVPAHEVLDPGASLVEVRERTARVPGPILEGPEERLGVGVVVADVRPTERRDDAEPLERGEHRGTLHGPTVVGVEHEVAGADVLAGARPLEKAGGGGHRLLGLDGPAHDLAAEHVEDQVQVKERAAYRAAEVRDVPRPDLVGRGGDELAGAVMGRRPRRGAVCEQALLAQHPIEAGLGGDVDTAVGQPGHDLLGRKVAEFGAVARRDDRGVLGFGQLVGGRRARVGAMIFITPGLVLPTREGPTAEANHVARGLPRRARGDRLFDERARHLSVSIII